MSLINLIYTNMQFICTLDFSLDMVSIRNVHLG